MSETIKITVNVAGRNYPLIVDHEEVDQVREIEKNLKAQYLSVSTEYPNLETQDHLAIILLTISRAINEEKANAVDNTTEDSKLQSIIEKIENHLT
jgi:hypothetical protein